MDELVLLLKINLENVAIAPLKKSQPPGKQSKGTLLVSTVRGGVWRNQPDREAERALRPPRARCSRTSSGFRTDSPPKTPGWEVGDRGRFPRGRSLLAHTSTLRGT